MQCAENRSKVRVVAGDRQYDSTELRQWTKEEAFKAETAIPTIKGKDNKKGGRGARVDLKFRVQVQSAWLRPTMEGFALSARHTHILNLDIF
jgi:hypothetical protein